MSEPVRKTLRTIAQEALNRGSKMRRDYPDTGHYVLASTQSNGLVRLRKHHWPEGVTVDDIPLSGVNGAIFSGMEGASVRAEHEEGDRQRLFVAAPLSWHLGNAPASRSHRGAWQQMESVPELSCLAWLQCELWEPIEVAEVTALLDLNTYLVEEGDPNYRGNFGGLIIFKTAGAAVTQVVALGRRCAPEGDPEDPDYPDDKYKLGLYTIEPDTGEVQWVAEAPGFVEGSIRNHLHHDPFARLLIARGPSDAAFRRNIYVWDQDANFKAVSTVGHYIRNTAFAEDFAVKCWQNADESGLAAINDQIATARASLPSAENPTVVQAEIDALVTQLRGLDNCLRGYIRSGASHKYVEAWSETPKTWLELPQDDTPSVRIAETVPVIYYQQSTVQAWPPEILTTDDNDDTRRYPYSVAKGDIAIWSAGHSGLNYWGNPVPTVEYPYVDEFESLEDRAPHFDFEIYNGYGIHSSFPHYRLTETRELRACVVGVDPRSKAVRWIWEKRIAATGDPLRDEDIMADVTMSPPSGALGTPNYQGWASHQQFTLGTVNGGGYNYYYAPVPDYRFFRPHLENDVLDLEIHPAGIVRDRDGLSFFAYYEPYNILVPPGTNGISSLSATEGVSGTPDWLRGGPLVVNYTAVDEYDYAGVLVPEMWKRTKLVRLDTDGQEAWEIDLSIFDTGYDYEVGLASGRSSLGRALKLPVHQIIPFPDLDRLIVLRDWADPAHTPPRLTTETVEIYTLTSGDFVARLPLNVKKDGDTFQLTDWGFLSIGDLVLEQFETDTVICYDDPPPEDEEACSNEGTFLAGAYKVTAAYTYPAKGAVDPEGFAWIALTGSMTDHETDETQTRLMRIILPADHSPPTVIIDVGDVRFPEGTDEVHALCFFENDGQAAWTRGSKLIGTLQP